METYRFEPGETPVLLSIPHVGTQVPPDAAAAMTPHALTLPDTDWHLDRLYHFAPALGVGFLKPVYSRYVIDLNREPDSAVTPSSPDRTEICPLTTFDDQPIHRAGAEPDTGEVARRIASYWRPYHERLAAALAALRERHGVAVLLDAHSTRSEVPRLFDGRLPDVALCTAGGASASPDLTRRVMNVVRATESRTHELNTRVHGGYTVRTYGRPADGVHAMQIELSRSTYMGEEYPFQFDVSRAEAIRPCLERMLLAVVDWAWQNATTGRGRRALF